MSDITVSNAVDNLLRSTSDDNMRSSLGLGTSDAVAFGALGLSQLNFPDLTTSELNAVTDADAGDTYFDSDRGQFVRFNSPSTYDVITTRSKVQDDISAATAAVSLTEARFHESGLVRVSTDVFNPVDKITIFTDEQFSSSAGVDYAYHDGSSGFLSEGWFDVSNAFGGNVTGDVVISGAPYRLTVGAAPTGVSTAFSFNQAVFSDITDKQFVSEELQGGSSYKIEVTAPIGDLAEGNLRFDVGYTGVYTDATIQIICDDIKQKQRTTQLKYKLSEVDVISFKSTTKIATDSPQLAIYTFTMLIKPSSDGIFTMSARQLVSSPDPLLIDKVQSTVSTLSS